MTKKFDVYSIHMFCVIAKMYGTPSIAKIKSKCGTLPSRRV